MLVQAKEAGYYNGVYRYAGQSFQLKDKEHFSKHWMVDLSNVKAKKAAAAKPAPAPAK